jgi:hypothetical protein
MRFEISDHSKRQMLLRFGVGLPFFMVGPGLLLWLYIIKPWPDVSREGAVDFAMLTIVFTLFIGASVRYLWRAFHGNYDIVFSGGSITLLRIGVVRGDQVEFVGAFKLPLFPRRAMLKVKRERPSFFRRKKRPVLVELGYYEDADLLEERLMNFAQATKNA